MLHQHLGGCGCIWMGLVMHWYLFSTTIVTYDVKAGSGTCSVDSVEDGISGITAFLLSRQGLVESKCLHVYVAAHFFSISVASGSCIMRPKRIQVMVGTFK
jgi:hypothetical protein